MSGGGLEAFLLACIAEDEAESGEWHRADCERNTYDSGPCDCGLPARVLAECEAKRRIVEDEHGDGRSGVHGEPWCWTCSDDEHLEHLPCRTLRLMGAVYAAHPDYDESWRP